MFIPPRGILPSVFFPKSSRTVTLESRSSLLAKLQFLLTILTPITLPSKFENGETLTTYSPQRLQRQSGYKQGAVLVSGRNVLPSGTPNLVMREEVEVHCWWTFRQFTGPVRSGWGCALLGEPCTKWGVLKPSGNSWLRTAKTFQHSLSRF